MTGWTSPTALIWSHHRCPTGSGTSQTKSSRAPLPTTTGQRGSSDSFKPSTPTTCGLLPSPAGEDAVDYFLFKEQRGYCTQFATALAVMGRLVGVPTRVVVGYLPGKYNSLTAIDEVRYQDAHAWA